MMKMKMFVVRWQRDGRRFRQDFVCGHAARAKMDALYQAGREGVYLQRVWC
jgi:hypothetical protein